MKNLIKQVDITNELLKYDLGISTENRLILRNQVVIMKSLLSLKIEQKSNDLSRPIEELNDVLPGITQESFKTYLASFETKVNANNATKDDFEEYKRILGVRHIENFIEERLKEYGIFGIEHYLLERDKGKDDLTKNKYINGGVLGTIIGTISALRKVYL